MPAMSKDSRRAQRTVLAAGAAAAVVAGSTGSTFVAGPVARTLPTASTVQQPAHIAAGAPAAPQSGSSAVLSAGGFALAAAAAARSGARKSKKVATKATAVSTEVAVRRKAAVHSPAKCIIEGKRNCCSWMVHREAPDHFF